MSVAAAAAAFTVVSEQGAQGAPAKQGCKLAGVRYVGSTSQKQKICFTLAADRRKLREYSYGFRDSCGSGDTRVSNPRTGSLTTLMSSGSFSYTGFGGSFVKGRVSGSTASGTLRLKQTNYGVSPPTTCDSGVVRWTARQAG